MTILTRTHRAIPMPDHMSGWGESIDTLGDTSPAPLIDKVDTTHTEHNWGLISIVLSVIAALSGVVIALCPPLEDAQTVAATTWPAK